MAEIKGNIGAADSIFGYSMMFVNIGAIIGNIVGPKIVTRIGTKRNFQLLIVAVGAAQVAQGFMNQIWQVPIMAFIAGISYSIVGISMNTQGSMVEEGTGKSVMPTFHGAWSLGACSSSLLAGLISQHFSPSQHLLYNSIFAVVGSLAISRALLPKSVDHHDLIQNSLVKQDEQIPPDIRKYLNTVALFLSLALIAEGSVSDWSSILLREDFHIPVGPNTLGFTSFLIAQLTGRFAAGKLIDRFGITKVIGFAGLVGGMGYMLCLFLAISLNKENQSAVLIALCLSYIFLGMGVSFMPAASITFAGSIPGLPTTRAVVRNSLFSSFALLGGRFLISSAVVVISLPVTLLLPGIALLTSGILAQTLQIRRLGITELRKEESRK
jgi:MFS family permease